jgi:hypothetical protein
MSRVGRAEGPCEDIEARFIHGDIPLVGRNRASWVFKPGRGQRAIYPHLWGYGQRTPDTSRYPGYRALA